MARLAATRSAPESLDHPVSRGHRARKAPRDRRGASAPPDRVDLRGSKAQRPGGAQGPPGQSGFAGLPRRAGTAGATRRAGPTRGASCPGSGCCAANGPPSRTAIPFAANRSPARSRCDRDGQKTKEGSFNNDPSRRFSKWALTLSARETHPLQCTFRIAVHGRTTSTPHSTCVVLPLPSVASAVQVMRVPTPPESAIVIVSPTNDTTQDSVLSMTLPFLVTLKQS